MPYLGIFSLEFYKLALSNLYKLKVSWKKQKLINLVPQIAYLDIFGIEFYKDIIIFEISTLKFA